MPRTKTAQQRTETRYRVELWFNEKENAAIEKKVTAYNKKHKTELTRKSYLQMLALKDAAKK